MTEIAELMVLPVPNQSPKAAFAAETGWMSHRLAEFEQSRANAGVELERVSLVKTPAGHITISYLEGSRGYRDVAKTIRDTPTVFDQDMMTRGQVLHGLSQDQQREKRVPLETSVYYKAATLPDDRGPWHSFAAMIRPDAVSEWLDFCAELNGPRRSEFEDFASRSGFDVVCAATYDHPNGAGSLSCTYLEGRRDPSALPRALAAGGAFGAWFAERFQSIHGADVREGVPSPAVAVPWDWVKGQANDVVAPLYSGVRRLLGE